MIFYKNACAASTAQAFFFAKRKKTLCVFNAQGQIDAILLFFQAGTWRS